MSISSIGSSGAAFTDMGIGLSGEGRLALLALESEETQQKGERQIKALAREQYIDASDEAIEALHDEADDMLLGAVVQGAATLTAAGIQLGDTCLEPTCDPTSKVKPPPEKPWGEIGAGVAGGVSAPLGKLFDAAVANDRADGKRAEQDAKLAEWQMADSKEAIQQSEQRQDKTTDWLAASSANQASATMAIIAGLA